MAVLASGFWVDFSKDILSFSPHADIVKAYERLGLRTEWSRLPLRLLHAGLSAGAAYVLFRGYLGVFRPDAELGSVALPVWRTSF
jgi:hypothetical protein